MIALPIDVVIPDLLAALAGGVAVLEAPPGSGKTTRVPPALSDVVEGQVWVLEPRRIAARASAARVASERGERVGESVGYAVRHDRKEGPATRVLYVTEALLARRIAADPWLRGIGAVVLDEFHERSIHTDLALALVAALRGERPDLRLLVMSATFDARAVADWLGGPRVSGGSRPFPVEIEHLARPDDRPVHELAAAGVRAEVARLGGRPAGILVFLPGVGEITRTQEALVGLDADVVPLHGELDAAAQDRALRPDGARPRVILATNVAETSLTVPDVVTVVDSGLARIAGHDPWSGLGTLDLEPVSRASADQRAGRAGRTGPGRCLRLYTKSSFDARPAETLPEIRRVDLAGVLLDLATRRRRPGEPVEPRWFEPPAPAAWSAARSQLERLGAIDGDELPTAIGAAMAGLPLSPRLARVLVEAAALGAAREGAALVARLDQGGRGRRGIEDPVTEALHGRLGDGAAQVRQQLVGMLGSSARSASTPPEEALSRALFAGFPDRVGRRRAAAGNAYGAVVFAEGGSAELDAPVPGRGDEVVVVAGVERIGGRAKVRAMTPIPEDWLLDAAEVRTQVAWVGSRVEVREQLVYGALILDDGPGAGDPEVVGGLLAEHALPVAHRVFPDAERAEAMVQRAAFLRRVGALTGVAFALEDLVRAACRGHRSFDELGHVSLCELAPVDRALVDRLAPDAIPLGNRARAPVTWPADGDPYLSSRMQDFFGLARSPTVANGRPLVLHLLAPSGRPVQVTTDLAGFWERHYPAIRKELCRKYPRHYWPEDPLQAEPIQHVRGGVPFKR